MYPLPLISELMYQLRGCNLFTKFDIHDGYHNILIKEQDIWKMAFLTNQGLFESIVMGFRLCNALATFQAMTNTIFRDFINKGWLTVYMNNIIIYTKKGKIIKSHREKVHKVLQRLEEHNLYLKPSKCAFKTREMDFLKIIVSHKSIAIDPKKLKGITDWQPSKDITSVRRFLGFTRFYRHFIAGYSELV